MASEEDLSETTTELARTVCSLSLFSSTPYLVCLSLFPVSTSSLTRCFASLNPAMSFLGLRKWPTPARPPILQLPLLV